MSKVQRSLMEAGVGFESLPQRSAWAQLRRWHEVYAAALHEQTRRWTLPGGFEWYVFGRGYYAAITGARAIEAYLALPRDEGTVYVVSGRAGDDEAYRCDPSRPTFDGADVLVFPEDLSWTMAFAHGHDGPFFARGDTRQNGQESFDSSEI